MTDNIDDLIPRLEAVTAALRSGRTTKHVRYNAAGRIDKITETGADVVSLIAEGEGLVGQLAPVGRVGDDVRHRLATAQVAFCAAALPFADKPSRARLTALLAEVGGAWASVGRPLPGISSARSRQWS